MDGLRTPAFDKAVRELTCLPWGKKVAAAHNQDGDEGALPAVTLDGSAVTVLSDDGVVPVSAREIVRQVRGDKGEAGVGCVPRPRPATLRRPEIPFRFW
ncbi:hypothetical protein [Streptomyces sp. Ac-502]|uniref:hypothetical protein n=1 Tax=Streptomyces sp. Ac-502 TaxID=3342801 RepID=UPI00386221FF